MQGHKCSPPPSFKHGEIRPTVSSFETIIEAWQPFFIAQLGAGATLLGLLCVGLSLNLTKIIASPALPTRALVALVLLLLVLVIASLMDIPYQA